MEFTRMQSGGHGDPPPTVPLFSTMYLYTIKHSNNLISVHTEFPCFQHIFPKILSIQNILLLCAHIKNFKN